MFTAFWDVVWQLIHFYTTTPKVVGYCRHQYAHDGPKSDFGIPEVIFYLKLEPWNLIELGILLGCVSKYVSYRFYRIPMNEFLTSF